MAKEIKKPKVYVIAGPNGAGKTTFVKEFLPVYADCINFINADLIASGLSPFKPEAAAIKAGRIMIEQMREYALANKDFTFETTLSGRSHLRFIRDLKTKGYEIHLIFLWIRNVDLAQKRVADRVRSGGHNVPEDVVRRRFPRGIKNFFNVYRPVLDSWMLFDNSSDEPNLVAEEGSNGLKVYDNELFKKIEKSMEGI